jgi:gas vesicle protein
MSHLERQLYKERRNEMKRTFWKGTFMGALVGALAGLLLAPKSGKETRDDIKLKVKGTYQDVVARLEATADEVGGKVDSLKEAAKDLKGEAREESQELIRRAELLKQDLRASAGSLSKSGNEAKDGAIKQVKTLLAEGADVMTELERVTKRLANSAKNKVNQEFTDRKAPSDPDSNG